MSATNRGGQRLDEDNYETPAAVTKLVLDAVELKRKPAPTTILEPNAGRGAIVDVLRERFFHAGITAVELNLSRYKELALKENCERRIHGDVLEVEHKIAVTKYDLGITNPAFAIALPVVQLMLRTCVDTLALLRLGFTASMRRRVFWQHNPADVYVLAERPSFAVSVKCVGIKLARALVLGVAEGRAPCGWRMSYPLGTMTPRDCPQCGGATRSSSSDATDYAWFHWSPATLGRKRKPTWTVL